MKKVDIELSWYEFLEEEFDKPYFISLRNFLRKEYKIKEIYPSPVNVFKAFNMTPVKNVKVVIIGQDPYHGIDQANGLCFSVPQNFQLPPSLKNIYKELSDDLDINIPKEGCLESWAKQGVLLLNSVLTVEKGKANSHRDIGWQRFTEKVIKRISDSRTGVVFMLWGRQAQDKLEYIDKENKYSYCRG